MSPRDWVKHRIENGKGLALIAACGAFATLCITATLYLTGQINGPNSQTAAQKYPNVAPEIAEQLDSETPNFGWAGQELADEVISQETIPRIQFVRADDNAKKNVRLWDWVKEMSGDHLPNFRQLIGDCVGAGAKCATEYLFATEYVRGPPVEDGAVSLAPINVFLPYHYACGRHAPECGNGGNRGWCRKDPSGSLGVWQAKALLEYGVIEVTRETGDYSKAVVSRWAVRMPEAKWVELGKLHRVKSIAQCRTASDIRDAICNGYPVTIASDWGGLMECPLVGDKRVNRKSGTWQHQMCVIGYDGSGAEPYWYVQNSWGPSAHGTPKDGAPPGGFWIRKADMEYIAKSGDNWAISDLDGFFEIDWQVIKERVSDARSIRAAQEAHFAISP